MSEKKTNKKSTKKTNKKNKKFLSRPAIVLLIGLLIIIVPLAVFGGILWDAQRNSSNPELGDRFENDLDPAITDEDISKLETVISSMSNVENVEINMTTAQLRINVDTTDSLDQESILAMVNEIYEKVNSYLPISKYFTSTDTMRMYDLSINVYNKISDDDSMIYYILTKNAMMDSAETQLVSEPINADLANELTHSEELYGTDPSASPEVTVDPEG